MRTIQIKSPTKQSLKQNLLVAAIIDIDLEKERRGKDANNRNRSGSGNVGVLCD